MKVVHTKINPLFLPVQDATSSKIWPNFCNKVFFFNLKLSKNHLNKKCAPNLLFFNAKKIRKIRMIFDIENSL